MDHPLGIDTDALRERLAEEPIEVAIVFGSRAEGQQPKKATWISQSSSAIGSPKARRSITGLGAIQGSQRRRQSNRLPKMVVR
jgi:hypothetical protein